MQLVKPVKYDLSSRSSIFTPVSPIAKTEILSGKILPDTGYWYPKENAKIICCKYYEIDAVVNVFAKQTVFKQHFRTIHRSTDVKDLLDINAKCKVLFQDSHGDETTKVIQQLSRLRLQTVNSSFSCDEMKI